MRRHTAGHRQLLERPFPAQLVQRQHQGHETAGDGGAAGAAVGLDHIAMDGNGPLAQCIQVSHRAQGPAHQPLDLRTAGGQLEFEISRRFRVSVARGSMLYSAVTHPLPLSRLKGGTPSSTVALQITFVCPTLDQHRTFGVFDKIFGNDHRPQLVRLSSVVSAFICFTLPHRASFHSIMICIGCFASFKKRAHELAGVEFQQVVRLFAHADEFHRHAQSGRKC